jgi:hypothetical protein
LHGTTRGLLPEPAFGPCSANANLEGIGSSHAELLVQTTVQYCTTLIGLAPKEGFDARTSWFNEAGRISAGRFTCLLRGGVGASPDRLLQVPPDWVGPTTQLGIGRSHIHACAGCSVLMQRRVQRCGGPAGYARDDRHAARLQLLEASKHSWAKRRRGLIFLICGGGSACE